MFLHHQLVRENGGYTLYLYLDPAILEFSQELFDPQKAPQTNQSLEVNVKQFISDTYPQIHIKSAKIMLGTVLLMTFTFQPAKSVYAEERVSINEDTPLTIDLGDTESIVEEFEALDPVAAEMTEARIFELGTTDLATRELYGQNRFLTSVVISQHGWETTAEAVVLGRGDLAIDALTASVLASKHQSPLLLTRSDQLPPEVSKEIDRLSPSTIFIAGGPGAISTQIEHTLKQKGFQVVRISGQNRFDTSVQVAKQIGPTTEVILTTGQDTSPDALSVAPYAGIKQIPIVFTQRDKLPPSVVTYLRETGIQKVTIIGGEAVISDAVRRELQQLGIREIERIAGANRYATSAQVAERFEDAFDTTKVMFASGESFIDALPASPLAFKQRSPILLIARSNVPAAIHDWLQVRQEGIADMTIVGGTSIILPHVRETLWNKGVIPESVFTDYYTVRSGDTLWLIANRYGVTVQQLREANRLSTDTLFVGQVLRVPPTVTQQQPQEKTITYTTHTVRSGDNMWNLSIQYGIPMAELLQVNNLTLNSVLFIGQRLTIPVHHIPVKQVVSARHGELLDWWTEARYVFPIGKIATITDFQTGRQFQVRHTMGGNHADSEPLTARDAQIMREIWGGAFSWTPRAIIVEVDGRRLAAAMHSYPHGDQAIRDNNYNGHFCIHFLNSRRHSDNQVQASMQTQIQIAAGLR